MHRETLRLVFSHNSFFVYYEKVKSFLMCIGQAALSIRVLVIKLRAPVDTVFRPELLLDQLYTKLRDMRAFGALEKIILARRRPFGLFGEGFSETKAKAVFDKL